MVAISSGVAPSWRGRLTEAPPASSSWQQSAWPARAAAKTDDEPSSRSMCAAAGPRERSSSDSWAWPRAQAMKSGVAPSLRRVSASARRSRSSEAVTSAASISWMSHATCSSEPSFPSTLAFGSAPCSTNLLTAAGSPALSASSSACSSGLAYGPVLYGTEGTTGRPRKSMLAMANSLLANMALVEEARLPGSVPLLLRFCSSLATPAPRCSPPVGPRATVLTRSVR